MSFEREPGEQNNDCEKAAASHSGRSTSQSSPPAQASGSTLNRLIKQLGVKVLKTKLDMEAVRQVMSQKSSEKEDRLREIMAGVRQGPGEVTAHNAIESYKRAAPCHVDWQQMKGGERTRFCESCQLQVYNFNGLGLAEAEEIVFQRESKRGITLYKREDGRFLSSDCPVGIARRRRLIVTAASAAFLCLALLAFALLTPRPQPTNVNKGSAPAPSLKDEIPPGVRMNVIFPKGYQPGAQTHRQDSSAAKGSMK
jgi:hypothetical protein